MRKYAYLLLLAVAALASTACNVVGTNNSDTGYNGGSNNAQGGAMTYGGGSGAQILGGTYWHGESRHTWNKCTPGILQQIESQLPLGLFGRWPDSGFGELSAFPMGTVTDYVKDNSGNGLASARPYQAFPGDPNALFSPGTGYTTGVYFDYGATVFPCGEQINAANWFQDDFIVRMSTTGVTSGAYDRLFFYEPVMNNDAANHDVSLNDGLAHMPLAKRIELLRSIDTSAVFTKTTPIGRQVEVLPVQVTAVTFGNSTLVVDTPWTINLQEMKAFAFDPNDPAFKTIAGWMADQFEAALRAGTKPELSLELNGSTTFSMSDLGNAHLLWGQSTIDKFREIAGSPVIDNGGSDSGRTNDGSRDR
jgi:hypothetical protein